MPEATLPPPPPPRLVIHLVDVPVDESICPLVPVLLYESVNDPVRIKSITVVVAKLVSPVAVKLVVVASKNRLVVENRLLMLTLPENSASPFTRVVPLNVAELSVGVSNTPLVPQSISGVSAAKKLYATLSSCGDG